MESPSTVWKSREDFNALFQEDLITGYLRDSACLLANIATDFHIIGKVHVCAYMRDKRRRKQDGLSNPFPDAPRIRHLWNVAEAI